MEDKTDKEGGEAGGEEQRRDGGAGAVRAVQVEHIRFDPGLKALGCQPVESTSPFKSSGFRCVPKPAPIHRGGGEERRGKAVQVEHIRLTLG